MTVVKKLKFIVVDRGVSPRSRAGDFILVRDGWDDFHFKTTFRLLYTEDDGDRITLGTVKIGQFGQVGEVGLDGRTKVESTFNSLDHRYFSVGQDREYYEAVMNLDGGLGPQVLAALQDIALSDERYSAAKGQAVTKESLFRDLTERVVQDQFRRISRGGAVLTDYNFTYNYPPSTGLLGPRLTFDVMPNSMPPSNVHVLIGSNGAGKTTLLNNMAHSLLGTPGDDRAGYFESAGGVRAVPFANVVTVSFSAFDPFADLAPTLDLNYSYVGLRSAVTSGVPKSDSALTQDFVESLRRCGTDLRRNRWLRAMNILYADPLLEESRITDFVGGDAGDSAEVEQIFHQLSSGHKIVVLTITRLVECVEEKTLALLDEPEAHLHPPLLSAFTRALSDLLEDRNGVAIIATHSPVIVQEVPETCVWTIRRTGRILNVERLDEETFGEGVGTLTSRVFGLEVTSTGYHQLLRKAIADTDGTYDEAVRFFGGHVGGEARAILRGLARRPRV